MKDRPIKGYRVKLIYSVGVGWDWEYSYHKTKEAAERKAARWMAEDPTNKSRIEKRY